MTGKHVMFSVTSCVDSNVDTVIYFWEKILKNLACLVSAAKPEKKCSGLEASSLW
jgi:hypothetical protein